MSVAAPVRRARSTTTSSARRGIRQVAVLGTGSAGLQHLAGLRKLEGVVPIAVPIRPARRAALAQEGVRTAEDLQAAYAMGARACVIATETARHVADARAALQCGFDVLVEKPLGATAAEASRAIGAATASRRRMFVGCVLRWADGLDLIRQRLPMLGPIHAVRVECQSYLPQWRPARPYQKSYSARAQDGGVLRDLIHEIDYAAWLFGWPDAVEARLENTGRLGIAAEELAQLEWRAPSGARVSVHLEYLTQPARRMLRMFGQEGTLSWDAIGQTVMWSRPEASERHRVTQPTAAMFRAQAAAFLRACDGFPDERLATAGDGYRALALCDAARRASDTRRMQKVRY